MNRVKISAVLPLNSFAVSLYAARFVVLGTLLFVAASQPRVHAITINMVYSNEGDPVPHPENPMWDPDGTILKAHFQTAKSIWESLLPGPGSYDFDFQWDDDIGATTLGLTTDLGPLDVFIEINPNQPWFADPTPGASEEFSTISQSFYSDLSPADRVANFTGAAPPDTLEVRAVRTGNTGSVGAGGYDAQNGYDLLSTIVHEFGHVLGVNVEPGDFNIDPQHVGGVQNVLVLENNGHLGGNATSPGFLMCDSCGTIGLRRLPTATDVLVIAEDQGMSAVHLERVASISSGLWSNANGWIGGAVPDLTQDVDIRHGGSVSLDADAQARNLLVAPGSNVVLVLNHRLTANGTLTFDGGGVSVGAGGTIAANSMIGDTAALTTPAGSLVLFNNFTRGASSSAASASFGGSVAIGFNTGSSSPVTFFPTLINTWNIAQNLTVGQERSATVVIKNGTWNVTGNVDVRGDSTTGSSEVVVDTGGTLNVTGHVIPGRYGKVTFKSGGSAANSTFDIQGGLTTVVSGPTPNSYHFEYNTGGGLTFEGTATAATATINVDGGVGFNAPNGLVTFKDNSLADHAVFHTKGGRRGGYSPYLCCLEEAGNGGQVRFENSSFANNATFINDGGSEFRGGTGGLTVFADTSTANVATFDNHGATYNKAGGGATHFLNTSTAGSAIITNHADATFLYSSMSGQTVFYDSSNAGTATIENKSGPNPFNAPGRTQFRNNSSANHSLIENRGNPTLGGGAAGLTEFFDTATAANATINLWEGYNDSGRMDFYNQSTAANAHIFIVNTDPPGGSSNGGGGNLIFHDNSTAAEAEITLRAQACCNGVKFDNNATAANAKFTQEDGSGGIKFLGSSTAGNATFSVGQDSGIEFFNQSNAGNATITMANRARLQFSDSASAGQSQIEIAGASAPGPFHLGAVVFGLNSTAGNAAIVAQGGSAAGAVGARVAFVNGGHAGNATITANGGTGGGAGATVGFSSGATGDTARLIANAGGTFDFGDQRTFGGTQIGSIEGEGTFALNGSLLAAGNRNTSTIVSGPIVNGFLSGGMLTKVGTGQLTLAGANTYTGLTTVNGGTVSVTGSIGGGAVVNNGGTLNGNGSIGGTVTVNSGGVFAPGTSPGTITLGGLTMTTGGTLDFEIGDPARDHIFLTNHGSVSLAGILNVSLLGGFAPTLGQSFSVFEGSVGSITGAFNSIVAPTFNGLTFGVMQNPGSLLLQVIQAPGSGSSSALDGTVPEPDGWRLVLAGGLLLLAFGRATTSPQNLFRLPRCATRRALPFCVLALVSSLLVMGLMPAATRATTVTVTGTTGTIGTPGTMGGASGGPGGPGGNGTAATATAATPADTSNTATATGGTGGPGGTGGNGTSAGGNGGAPGLPGNASATATTTANGGATSAFATATGGFGGSGGWGGNATQVGSGGAGASATNAGNATASATVNNGQLNGSVVVQAKAIGGAGGPGGPGGTANPGPIGTGGNGSNGGTASLGTVSGTANGGNISMTATLQGGVGFTGSSLYGNGGNGANASLPNSMTASTTGAITLTQDVLGGQGGYTGNGAAGTPGTAASSLTLNDLVASALTGFSIAKGGLGGGALSGGNANGTNGAAAASDISFTGKGSVTVYSTGTGGAGGSGSGSGKVGGDGATATATASGTSTMGGGVTVRAENYGGLGGSGPTGGNGANASLINAVNASTTGFVGLTQNALAGSGGDGSTGAAGAGGDAISTLVFNQSGPSNLTINTMAAGGGSGSAFSAAPGGSAISSIDATCTGSFMNLTAQAVGNAGSQINASGSNNNAGAGGVGIVGFVRGNATSLGAVTLDLRAIASGGAGGSVTVGNGNGGNGGAASLIDVIDASASTTSTVTMSPTAGAGAGGSALGGLAGVGGAATSYLTRSMNVSSLGLGPRAVAGAGGAKTSASGVAGAGGNASASAVGTNSRTLSSGATAIGGNGGTGASGASGGGGGSATATTSGNNSSNQNVSVSASATGGNGGDAGGAGSGGAGGAATVSSVFGSSSGGAPVGVTAQQFGGNGGNHTSGTTGSGGNGAPSSMTNIVSGSTSGTLTLSQQARSGSGGPGSGAAGGSSANALSSLTSTNPGGGRIIATATAVSGIGGGTFGTGTPGNSGDVTATMNVFSSTNQVNATAIAQAGAAGVNSTNMASGTRGIGTAMALATTTNGFFADANATVSGRNALVNAVANTSSGIVSSMSLSATANPVNNINPTSVRAYGFAGAGFESFPSNTAAHGAALPSASNVTNNLSGDPNVTAAYNSPDGKTPLALVALNMVSPNQAPALSVTLSTSASFSFDVTTLQSGKLLVGLLDPVNTGPAFTSLHFSISREGAIVEDQTFATPAAATTYFNDHVLDLGALKAGVTGTLDLTFLMEMTTLDNGARYGANFLVADVGLVGVPGDYNNNGVVDGADYVVWRKFNNTNTVLPNDPNSLPIDGDQYNTWRTNFGATSGSGAGPSSVEAPSAAVPEPSSALLLVFGIAIVCCRTRQIATPAPSTH